MFAVNMALDAATSRDTLTWMARSTSHSRLDSPSRFIPSSLTRVLSALVVAITIGALLAGCGGKGDNEGRGDADRNTSRGNDMVPGAPAWDAGAEEVGDWIDGDWTISLIPEVASANVEVRTITATFSMADFTDDGDMMVADLTGEVRGTGLTGRATMMPNGESLPTVEFTTNSLTIPSLTGEDPMTVDGPMGWSATLSRGMLIGTVTGPDGRQSSFEARPQ